MAAERPAQAAYPSENGKIAFSRVGPYNGREIYTMNPDGSNLTNITNNPMLGDIELHDSVPVWSPDGSKIIFSIRGMGIFTMNAWDGSNLTQLTSGNYFEDYANWQPIPLQTIGNGGGLPAELPCPPYCP